MICFAFKYVIPNVTIVCIVALGEWPVLEKPSVIFAPEFSERLSKYYMQFVEVIVEVEPFQTALALQGAA
jgi:hypothetical protein